MMKSGIEEMKSSDGTSIQKAFSSHKSKDELSSSKMSTRSETSKIFLPTKLFSMPRYIDRGALFNSGENENLVKTTSESEENCHGNYLSNRYRKSDNEGTYQKSYAADASDETSREEVSSFKTVDKPSALNLQDGTAIWETAILEKPSSTYIGTRDRLLSFNGEDKHSSNPTNIFSYTEEIYNDDGPSKKEANSENQETCSPSSVSDASDRIASLVEIPSASKVKDVFLMENMEAFRSESPSKIPSKLMSVLSEFFNNTNADSGSPDRTISSPVKNENDELPFCLICSSMANCCRKNSKASNKQMRKSDDETHSLFAANYASRGMLPFQAWVFHLLFCDCKTGDGSLQTWLGRDEITDLISFVNNSNFEHWLNRVSCDPRTDIACPELSTPSPVSDDSGSSSCSSMNDYYDDDEDIQQFCLQEKLSLQNEVSYKEALKNENHEEPNLIASHASSDRNCGSPICQFMLKEVESLEDYLLMQVQEFFSNNHLDENEIMSAQESINNIITSKYFNDEFAEYHELTVSKNGVERIKNSLEDDKPSSFSYGKNSCELNEMDKPVQINKMSL